MHSARKAFLPGRLHVNVQQGLLQGLHSTHGLVQGLRSTHGLLEGLHSTHGVLKGLHSTRREQGDQHYKRAALAYARTWRPRHYW